MKQYHQQHAATETRKAKLLPAFAIVLICSLLLAACSSKSETQGSGSSDSGGSKEKVTLKVEVFDRGNSPTGYTITDNYWTNWIQENFGDSRGIQVQYVPVPRSEEVEKLNVLMASGGSVPDIVFTYDTNTFNRYAKQEGLTDLSELLEQYGPNLKKLLGDEVLSYGQYDGKQYAIPAKRTQTGKYASFIRQDWLDKLGLPVPQNADELYETLKAFKEKDPGGTGGQVIPMGMSIASAQYETLLWSFIKPLTEEERYTLTQQLGANDYPTLLPGFKEGLQYMNKLYNEGLMSRDFGLDKDRKKLGEDIATGKVGFFSEDDINIFYENGTYASLQNNVAGAVIEPVDVYKNEEGIFAKPQYAPNGLYIMIPKSSERAVEAIQYLDWMAQEDVLFTLQNGIEGENYELVDGIPVMKNDQTQEALNRMYNFGDMTIVSNGKQFGSLEKNLKARAYQFPERFLEQVTKAQQIANTDTIPLVLMPRPIEAQTKYGTALLDKFNELIVKTTMAKPEQFESEYKSMLEDYMRNGGQAILDERKAVYEEMKSK